MLTADIKNVKTDYYPCSFNGWSGQCTRTAAVHLLLLQFRHCSFISENDPFLFNKTQSTEVIGTGFIINQKWNINCQYVFPANTTYSPFYTLNESRASLGINYIF